jgi:hypothetical protein
MLETRDSSFYVVYEMHNVFVYAILAQEEIRFVLFSEYDSIYLKFLDIMVFHVWPIIYRLPL